MKFMVQIFLETDAVDDEAQLELWIEDQIDPEISIIDITAVELN